jgi:peptidyl-prolyl cis-trans isomerase B (cyclophilin B)
MIKLTTNHGDITIELFEDKAPLTCANFKQYVEDGHFNGTIFHRVIPNFMIQGGGFEEGMVQKGTRENIKNEANNGLSNEVGTLAMARTPDPHSASSQFFINTKHNGFLDFTSETSQGYGYCVFAKVTDGMDTVKAIEGVSTTNRQGHADVPVEDVTIISAEIM